MNPEIDPIAVTLLAIILAFFVIVFFIAIVSKVTIFKRELDYLNIEIARTEGRERQYWKRKMRRLWMSLLPFACK